MTNLISTSLSGDAGRPSLERPLVLLCGAAVLLGGLGACTVQHPYRRPALPMPVRWANASQDPDGPQARSKPVDEAWWRDLGDPAIDALVGQAMADNPTIGEMLARRDQAAAQRASMRAEQLPRVDMTASLSRAQIGDSNSTGSALAIRSIRQSAAAYGPSLSWEIDLWGRLRQRRAAAASRFEARLADVRAARLSIAAEIADAVVVLRACTISLHIRESDIASRERELAIARQRLAFGSIAAAEVAAADTNLANVRTDRFSTAAACLRTRDALVALSGRDAGTVERLAIVALEPAAGGEATPNRAADLSELLPTPPDAQLSIPATMLLRHPAVVATERELAARWMEIGAARAERLPSINVGAMLTGQWLSVLGSGSSFATWSIGPTMAAPLFDGGAGKAAVRLAQARYRESLATLLGALRTATREIEDALADQRYTAARLDSSRQAVAAARVSMRAGDARWRTGAISAFDLETTRRALNTAEDSAVVAARDRARAWIALVRSTGGGIHHPIIPAADERIRS